MIQCFSQLQFSYSKSRDLLSIKCEQCNNIFYRPKNQIQAVLNGNSKLKLKYCSSKCVGIINNKSKKVKCEQCNKEFFKQRNEFTRSSYNFCSKSCAAKYNNTHKKTGIRRSKLEIWIEDQLTNLYPNLKIHFNRKDTINSELDIYIPSLKLAFELNGIFHYEPIFGNEKLNKIQKNDNNKFFKCQEKNISLCIIDTSSQKYFKEQTSKKFLDIITNIINQNLAS